MLRALPARGGEPKTSFAFRTTPFEPTTLDSLETPVVGTFGATTFDETTFETFNFFDDLEDFDDVADFLGVSKERNAPFAHYLLRVHINACMQIIERKHPEGIQR